MLYFTRKILVLWLRNINTWKYQVILHGGTLMLVIGQVFYIHLQRLILHSTLLDDLDKWSGLIYKYALACPWGNQHNTCTINVYKLDACTGVGSILQKYASRVLVPAYWQWFMKFPQHLAWQVKISPVLSGIDNKPTI